MKRSGGLDAVLLIVWCLILAGQGAGRLDLPGGPGPGFPDGASPESPRFSPAPPPRDQPLHPRFTPVAVLVPPIGSSPVSPVSLPGRYDWAGTPTWPKGTRGGWMNWLMMEVGPWAKGTK